jgi:PKD repeat protein
MSVPQKQTRWAAIGACALAAALAIAALAAPGSAPAAPSAVTITATQAGNGTMTMQFSSDAAGATALAWNFGEPNAPTGNTSTDPSPAHTYAVAGNYTVTLSATFPDATSPVTGTLTVAVLATPTASFTATQLANGNVQFTNTSTGGPTSWAWTFPGGSFSGQSPPPQQLPVGTIPVTLTVANAAGPSAPFTVQVVVTAVNSPPSAAFTITPSIAGTDAPVTLNASSSTDANGDVLTYNWDLNGDGKYTDATGPLQTLTFTEPGTYRVGVIVSDTHSTSTFRDFVTVLADKAPVVDFTTSPAAPAVGAPVTFTATASDPDGRVIKVEWDVDNDGQFDNGTGPTTTTSFSIPGSRIVAVRATDDKGVATIAFHTITVTGSTTGLSVTPTPPGSTPVPTPRDSASSSRRLSLLSPFPIIRVRGLIFHASVHITLLSIRAPKGATVRLYCHGRSCAKKKLTRHVRSGKRSVRFRTLERRLRKGTLIQVLVTAPGRIGKYTSFRIRADAAPARADLCLRGSGSKPVRCPS